MSFKNSSNSMLLALTYHNQVNTKYIAIKQTLAYGSKILNVNYMPYLYNSFYV